MMLATMFTPFIAMSQTNSDNMIFCTADMSYYDCVDAGYFNRWGTGQTGGGDPGGYCQNVANSPFSAEITCSDGSPGKCAASQCFNSPGSNKYCVSSKPRCCDGTTGVDKMELECAH